MSDQSIKRRDFLRLLGIGSTVLGIGLTTFKVVGKTGNGVLVESKNEYGGFLVEKLTNGKYPYQVKPETLKPMSEKYTVFSRNVWDPARQSRPELAEDLEELYLVKGKGKVPNQTRLDYAFMAASWGWGNSRSFPAYKWETQSGMVRFLFSKIPNPWNPADLDMSWEDASQVLKHAALFYGASQAGIAELNPLWLYSDFYSPDNEQKDLTVPLLSEGERFEQEEEAWYIPKSMNRVMFNGNL
jgi:hypothetical protein